MSLVYLATLAHCDQGCAPDFPGSADGQSFARDAVGWGHLGTCLCHWPEKDATSLSRALGFLGVSRGSVGFLGEIPGVRHPQEPLDSCMIVWGRHLPLRGEDVPPFALRAYASWTCGSSHKRESTSSSISHSNEDGVGHRNFIAFNPLLFIRSLSCETDLLGFTCLPTWLILERRLLPSPPASARETRPLTTLRTVRLILERRLLPSPPASARETRPLTTLRTVNP